MFKLDVAVRFEDLHVNVFQDTRVLGLSQTTGYAIKALSCLNQPECDSRSTPEIAACARVPRPYLAKIINALAHHGLVIARRGVGGGVSLARKAEQISLLQIVEAVEGKDWLADCLLGLNDCSDLSSCPTHEFWQRISREIRTELSRRTLADLIQSKDPGKTKPTAVPRRVASSSTPSKV
jgi:Rrf2 family transcriptional regulator, iron-sulfur cluster assembly transcription factor